MIGYPPSPAVEPTKPLPPVSPVDKIPSNKEQEFATIQVLNKRLKGALEKDRNENLDLEKKRVIAKDALSRARQELDKVTWGYTQASQDLLVHKDAWASTETDLVVKGLNNSDKQKYVDHLLGSKAEYIKSLNAKIAKKSDKLAHIERLLAASTSTTKEHAEAIDGISEAMQAASDSLKQKMVTGARLENDIRETHHVYGIEQYHEKRRTAKCESYGDLDPATYTSRKEARSIKAREKELETRFHQIYDDTVAQMIEQHQKNKQSFIAKQKQSADEKLAIEAQMKDLKAKRVILVNDIQRMEQELGKLQKEVHLNASKSQDAELEIPAIEKAMNELNEKIGILNAELKTLSQKADERERNCASLNAAIREKQNAAIIAKQEEEEQVADLKARLKSKLQQIEEATIGLYPEISKYRGLVDVVEVKLTPQMKRQKRTTL